MRHVRNVLSNTVYFLCLLTFPSRSKLMIGRREGVRAVSIGIGCRMSAIIFEIVVARRASAVGTKNDIAKSLRGDDV